MEGGPSPTRGRARGRSRGPVTVPPVIPPVEVECTPEELEERRQQRIAYEAMFVEPQRRPSSSSSHDGNGAGNGSERGGASGSGSDRGGTSGTGTGNGRGSPGDRGGIPRAGLHQGDAGQPGQFAMDYVVTRPSPDFNKVGKAGQTIRLLANYFMMKTHPRMSMSFYSLKIEPELEDFRKIKSLLRTKIVELGAYVHSGFLIFTPLPIKAEIMTFQAQLRDDPTMYTVTFDFKREVGESEPVVLQFHNILVRMIQQGLKYELLGRHYFDPTRKERFPNWKLDLWPGFQNSIRQQEAGLMMNVESVWKVVHTTSILQLMSEIKNRHGNVGPGFQKECNETFVGLMVVTKYNNKAYKVDEISFTSNPSSTFPKAKRVPGLPEEIIQVKYSDYYRERYNLTIGNPAQPLLVSKPTRRDIRRGQTQDVLLVPEFCYPCGLNEDLRNNFRLMKDLARCLHMEPNRRLGTTSDFVRSISTKEELRATLKTWGVQIAPEPAVIENARALPSQELLFANGQKVTADDKGDWTMGMRNVKMMTSMRLATWAIVITSRDSQNVGQLISTMQRVATPLGYQINKPEVVKINDTRAESYIKGVNQAMEIAQGRLDMIFVVLANNNLDTYSAVKQRCSKHFGIVSQCFLAKNMQSKGLMSICTKMVIQMNAKQGGEPWGVTNPLKAVMVLGYDVHHAGAGGGSSVGAMTATVSPSLGRFYSAIHKLPVDRQEVGPAVAALFEKCLRAYAKRNNNILPSRLMMYRDGVGEGQLREVRETEVEAFKAKIEAVYKELNQPLPKLSYIIVNKRINTRLFLCKDKSLVENPKPGTVVDDVVTRPERYDFFLISQTARQGCVSPTYYNVIYDESSLTPDQMQMYTYRLCHLYYNWSGTVAVPGPCQNAHKFAFQAGTALKGPASIQLEYLLHFL